MQNHNISMNTIVNAMSQDGEEGGAVLDYVHSLPCSLLSEWSGFF